MKRFKISTLFEGIDGLTRPMRAINRALGRFRRQAAGVKAAWSKVTTAGGSFVRSLRNVGLGAAAAGAGLFQAVKRAVGLGDSVAKTSEKLGLVVEDLQELRGAAQLAGVAQTALDMGVQRFTRRVAEAVGGTGEAKDALAALGIQLTDTQGRIRAAPVLLGDVADALFKIKDPATRVRIAFKLFDSEGVSMVNMLNKGSKGLTELRARFRATGAVMSGEFIANTARMNDEMTLTGAALRGVAFRVLAEFLPALIDATRELGAFIKANRADLVERVTAAVISVTVAAKGLTAVLAPVASAISGMVSVLGGAENAGTILAGIIGVKLAVSFGALLASVVATAKAVGVLALAFAASPFGLITLGVAALAAGAVLLVKNWKTVAVFFSRLWGGIRRIFALGVLFILDKIQSVTSALPDFVRTRIGIDGLDATIRELRAATAPSAPPITRTPFAPPGGAAPPRQGSAEVTVQFQNAPPGTRVTEQRARDVDLAVDTGLSMAGAGFGG